MAKLRYWTPEEDAIVEAHYASLGGRPTLAKIWAAGFNDRTLRAVQQRALFLDATVTRHGRMSMDERPLIGAPRSVGRQLFELAESNPTPAEYEARKAQILKEATGS